MPDQTERDQPVRDEPETPAATAPGQEPPARPPSPEDGRARLWRAVATPTRGQLVVALLLALVGFAAVTQVRTNTVDDTYAGLREQDLIDILNDLAGTTQRAQSEISRLEDTRDDLQSDTDSRRTALDQARDQADTLSVLAGTVPVSGPGITITIKQGAGEVAVSPFLDMVQALRNSGAEAMQINDEVRVVAQSYFADGADGLLVDGTLLEPPYTVDVIGNPDSLESGLRFPDGPRDQFAADGAELTYDEVEELPIETTTQVAEARDARPAS